MENLTKTQLVLLVLLVSFITSLVTGIVSVTLVNQAPAPITQTINRVIEKVIDNKSDNQKQNSDFIITSEGLIIKLVADTLPAVVSITASKDVPVIEQYFINPFENDDFFRRFFSGEMPQILVPQYRQKGTEKRQISAGSGFFVTEDGYLVTNRHVVEDKTVEYTVLMNDGRKMKAEVLARDSVQDVAILKVDGGGFAFISLGNSDNLKVGQTVVAIGNALGEFQNTVSVGVIAGLSRTIVASGSASGPEVLQEVIQTDAAINPGNSGGPLLDSAGRAIGINTAVASEAQSIGFALPINSVKKAVSDVRDFGKISYAYLGVHYLSVTPQIKEEKKLSVDYGALLIAGEGRTAIINNSPAQAAGLKEGDIILEFGGVRVNKDNTLAKLISQRRVGEKVELKVLRNAEELKVEAELVERPQNL
ncbi:MAG: trypsin-like peptidase domain-containing protein [Candidatus Niyogibacteria bacterium]|nr:MAG: trypsin-like peptidase domain-containing protein [Candidatus Niyogibacteria bacterium]